MKNDKEHLDIDLEFLDEKDIPKTAPVSSTGSDTSTRPVVAPVSTGYKYNWKNILIIGGIVLFIGWAIFSNSGSSSGTPNTGTTNSNSDNNVATGQYMCSQYNHDQAATLDPDPNNTEKQNLTNQQNALQTRSNEIDAEKAQLQSDKTSVDQTDQSALDAYNAQVDSYNAALRQYNTDQQSLSNAIDDFNAKVKVYNDFLIQNCTPQ